MFYLYRSLSHKIKKVYENEVNKLEIVEKKKKNCREWDSNPRTPMRPDISSELLNQRKIFFKDLESSLLANHQQWSGTVDQAWLSLLEEFLNF